MTLIKNVGPRYFLIQRDDAEDQRAADGSPVKKRHAVITFDDASEKEIGAFKKAVLQTMQGNKGAKLDDDRQEAISKLVEEFALARIVSAPGFEVEDENGRRELSWETDRAAILKLIPHQLWELYKRTVESLTTPPSPEAFNNAAAMASRTFPN